MRILGIDPGLRLTGYGCIDEHGFTTGVVEAGVLRLCGRRGSGRGEGMTSGTEAGPSPPVTLDTPARSPCRAIADRLLELDADLTALLARLSPTVVAVEALFAHSSYPATSIVMGHARGVVLLAARRAGATLVEIRPSEVKRFVTGSGRASKPQVQAAVRHHLGLKSLPGPPDIADALALALCAAWRYRCRIRHLPRR